MLIFFFSTPMHYVNFDSINFSIHVQYFNPQSIMLPLPSFISASSSNISEPHPLYQPSFHLFQNPPYLWINNFPPCFSIYFWANSHPTGNGVSFFFFQNEWTYQIDPCTRPMLRQPRPLFHHYRPSLQRPLHYLKTLPIISESTHYFSNHVHHFSIPIHYSTSLVQYFSPLHPHNSAANHLIYIVIYTQFPSIRKKKKSIISSPFDISNFSSAVKERYLKFLIRCEKAKLSQTKVLVKGK